MKTRLHVLLYGVLVCSLLLFSQAVSAQIDYSEDFEGEFTWTDADFDVTDELMCEGEGSLIGNFYYYYYPDWGIEDYNPASTVSPSIGSSNGMEATLIYSYKLIDYNTEEALLNTPEWGSFVVQYSSSVSGPWTVIETVNASNHTVSDACAERTATFTPAPGAVYLRIFGDPNSEVDVADVIIYVDNITVTQEEQGGCTGTPAASSAIATTNLLCNSQEASLSLQPLYTSTGLSFQWQSSSDGENYEDIEGATLQSYSGPQSQSTWYRAVITCDDGDESVTSEAIQVVNSGAPCYCEVDFANNIEPITLVEFAGIDNTSDATLEVNPALENFTSLDPAEVVAGGTYDITVQGNTGGNWTNYFKLYIDFNHNGDFNDEGESFEIGTIYQSTGTDGDEVSAEITIPVDAMTGLTTMRVFKLYAAYSDDPCMENAIGDPYGYGQAEDYLINISAPEGCTTAPEMAIVETNETTVCTTEGTELSLSVIYDEGGISYQWQSSEDGEEFADIDGATDNEYETEPTDMDMWYRAVITCENGDLSTTTEAVEITTTGLPCYCEVDFASGVEPVTLVQFAGIDNSSDDEIGVNPALEDFTSLTPGEVMQGGTYDIALQANTGGPNYTSYFKVYIDFNHNGNLNDEGESFEIGSIMGSTGIDGAQVDGEITIPTDAMTGLTYMRVLKLDNEYSEDSCEGEFGSYSYGQAEDYLINIIEPPLFDYYNLQWPATLTYPNGTGDYNIYAQAYEPGVTEAAGIGEGVMGWIGFNTENTDPATWPDSYWVEGTFNQTDNNNDEVMLTVDGSLPAGTYYYASRWKLADGPYTYGGFQGASGDEGVVNGVLTVLCTTMEPSIENPTQEFCNGATVADLQATATEEGGEIVWYLSADAETALPSDTLLADGTAYFAAQVANGCEGEQRGEVVAMVNMITPPVVNNHVIEVDTGAEATVEDLTYTGEGTINWYANLDDIGEASIEAGTVITPGTYYATLTVDGCESDYVTFTVDVLLGANGFTKGTFTYYPNPVKDMLRLSYSEGITGVEVFNLVGQRVISMTMGQNEAVVDMAALASGTYVVKVSSGDAAAMIKVVKE